MSVEKMSTGLYHATISNSIKDDLKDHNENIILTKREQSILLVSHLIDLAERKNFKKAKFYLTTTFVVNNYKIKGDNDLTFQMLIAIDTIEKVQAFFKQLPPETHDFLKQKFLFDKNLNSIQKILVMQWYTNNCQIIDPIFESAIKKFRIVDEEEN